MLRILGISNGDPRRARTYFHVDVGQKQARRVTATDVASDLVLPRTREASFERASRSFVNTRFMLKVFLGSKRRSKGLPEAIDSRSIFSSILEAFWRPLGVQVGPQNRAKFDQKSIPRCFRFWLPFWFDF